ncbi:ORF6N domain-containing protein [Paenalcaligenes niemegkensis]|uniref:ORF6N domain-containing protein n=1 Tax=Paenalcaligenes niemegkensis TaxID=2895469 RepID=UPI001EE86484|nr:ORF6N domain-containing protein [Paenalcaligenes niemegkensis]MCQ9615916.1 ORF6N domain-containing protein [Paenalcaligenes niemegkensis]
MVQKTTKATSLPIITWSGQRVTTTELLARQYGAQANNITKNFNRNEDRFIEGRHFFRLAGANLRALKDRMTESHSVTSRHTRELILWTKRGAARHAKMLETNQAWDVFEALEESYFEREEIQGAPRRLSTVRDRVPLLIDSVLIMARHRISLPFIYRGLSHYVGVDRFRSMTFSDVAKAHQFAERILTGQDTDNDSRQLQSNRAGLLGQQMQLELNPPHLLDSLDRTKPLAVRFN